LLPLTLTLGVALRYSATVALQCHCSVVTLQYRYCATVTTATVSHVTTSCRQTSSPFRPPTPRPSSSGSTPWSPPPPLLQSSRHRTSSPFRPSMLRSSSSGSTPWLPPPKLPRRRPPPRVVTSWPPVSRSRTAGRRQEVGPRIHVFLNHGDRDHFSVVHRHHHRQLSHPGRYHDGGNPSGHLRSSCCSDGVLLKQNAARSTAAAWQEEQQRPRQR
jgi:hypothetical protein